MLLRIWLLGHELLTVQWARDPIEELLEQAYEGDEDDEELALSWLSSDPEDQSHVIWHPAEVNPDAPC